MWNASLKMCHGDALGTTEAVVPGFAQLLRMWRGDWPRCGQPACPDGPGSVHQQATVRLKSFNLLIYIVFFSWDERRFDLSMICPQGCTSGEGCRDHRVIHTAHRAKDIIIFLLLSNIYRRSGA